MISIWTNQLSSRLLLLWGKPLADAEVCVVVYENRGIRKDYLREPESEASNSKHAWNRLDINQYSVLGYGIILY